MSQLSLMSVRSDQFTFLRLCNLTPAQTVQHFGFLEPQLLCVSQILLNVLNDMHLSDSTFSADIMSSPYYPAISIYDIPTPIYLYQKHHIKRKDSNVSSEDLAKVNGFILATIFYVFHRVPPNAFRSEEEKIQEERERYATEKQTFLQQYSDLLQTAVFSEIELHFLVNYEYVIRWIYQNIFSQGKQVNQEYVMIAGMALEGSHRIWARGGGSRGDRRVREEIYRRVSGKRKHKRTSKDSLSEEDNAQQIPPATTPGEKPSMLEAENLMVLSDAPKSDMSLGHWKKKNRKRVISEDLG
eukprot:gene15837-17814_t